MSIINPRKPKLVFQPVDDAGAPDGDPVDVSCDIQDFDPDVDVPSEQVITWCNTETLVGDPSDTLPLTVVMRDESRTRWAPLVGKNLEAQVWDRETDAWHRTFKTYLPVDPTLYGSTQPGTPRTITLDLPSLRALAWSEGPYTPPEPEALTAKAAPAKAKAEAAA